MIEIKVLHVGEYAKSGVATYVQILLNHPERLDIEDYVICSDKNSVHDWKIPKSHVIYYSYTRGIAHIFSAMLAIHKTIKKIKPDAVYCHSTWAGLFVRFPLLFIRKRYLVLYNAHGWAFLQDISNWKRKLYATIERILLSCTDTVINVSKYEYRSAIEYGLSKDKQVVIYSGISPLLQPIDADVKMPSQGINMLFVGRFDPQKGLDLLLAALSEYKHDDLHLTVIGDNVIGGKSLVVPESTERVTFLGWIPHEKLGSYYRACDVVVMPSRWEAFGLTAVEAMKYGKPVIASDKGALPELIHNGVNGYIINFQDRASLNKLNLTKEKLKAMGRQAEKDFHKSFESERMIRETFLLYSSETDRSNG